MSFRADYPLQNREEADLPEKLMMAIAKVGYKDPTPIQRSVLYTQSCFAPFSTLPSPYILLLSLAQAIPIGLQNRDVVGIAEVGVYVVCVFLSV